MDNHQYQQAMTDALIRIGKLCEQLQGQQQQQSDKWGASASIIVKPPPPFSGKSGENIGAWIFQVESFFEIKQIPAGDRLRYMPSFLGGQALVWFQSACTQIKSQSRGPFETWDSFLDELQKQFLPPNHQQSLRRQLRRLQQKGSVQAYISEFREIVSQIGNMSEEDKICFFTEGLQHQARNELFYRSPSTLDEAISIASSFTGSKIPIHEIKTYQAPQESDTHPMELGALSKGKKYIPRPKKFCEVHGSGYHSTQECRAARSGQIFSPKSSEKPTFPPRKLNTISQVDNEIGEELERIKPVDELNTIIKDHFEMVNGSKADLLCFQGVINGHTANILVDSGATHDYISSNFIKKHEIVTSVQKRDSTVALADGTTVKTSEVTGSLKVKIQHFTDKVKFHVFPLSGYDAVLGRPWLYRHNPAINWRQQVMEISNEGDSYIIRKSITFPSANPKLEPQLSEFLNSRQVKDLKEFFILSVVEKTASPNGAPIPPPIAALVNDYRDIFPDELPGLPPVRSIEHVIETANENPIAKSSYRMSPKELSELKTQLDELLRLGFIQPSSSPWASPVLFARKKDGQLRLCTDYRGLNAITKKNRYPIPRIDEILDSLQGAKIFTKLDLRQGYHQIRINPSDVPKTAFKTHFGHFEYKVMPFGLSNAPATFMHLMNSVFHDILNSYVTVYLDDILIFSSSLSEHVLHITEVFKRLRDNKLYAKLSKCEFCVDKIEFLGHVVSPAGISVDSKKVQAISSVKRPSKLSELQSFLGLVGYYRRFIPNFSTISAPLTNLTKKDVQFIWGPEQETSFEELKRKMITAPVLKIPDFDRPFVVTTDASAVAVAGILSQEYEDGLHPVCFESHKLNQAESNYPAHELEAYAIIYCFKQWRCYLEGSSTIVQTDHAALRFLKTQKNLSRRLTRWVEYLQQFEFEIRYKPGKENLAADALSRLCILDGSWPEHYYQFLDDGTLPETLSDSDREKVTSEASKYHLENETLYYLSGDKKIPYVPLFARADLTAKYHSSFGHLSGSEIYGIMVSRCYWPSMKKDVQEWIATCPKCQLSAGDRKTQPTEPLHPLHPLPAFHRWGLDFIGPLPKSKQGNKYVLVGIDHTTKWPVVRAVKTCDAQTVAEFLKNDIFLQFGCPSEIISDRGAAFRDSSLKIYLESMAVKHNLTSAYHPRSNGVTERFNGLLGRMLSKYVATEPTSNWEDYLDQALLACRIRAHRATGFSPFYLVYGQHPKIPGDNLLPSMADLDEVELINPQLEQIDKLHKDRKTAIENLKIQKEIMKQAYAKKLRPSQRENLEVGRAVLVRNEGRKKFEPKWLGPLLIRSCLPNGLFELKTLKGDDYGTRVHRDRLRLALVNYENLISWRSPKRFDKRLIKTGEM